jgi:transcriptional regulator with XRE-family HTH domain
MVETFGRALRRLREQAGLSQPDLARRVPISQSSLSRYESDRQQADPTTADRLDQLLDANGTLRALLTPIDAARVLTPDDRDRLTYVADKPRSVDPATLTSLTAVLAESRRMEDQLGARIMLEPTLGYLRMLEALTFDARGPIRPHVVDLAGQWAQFTGWLYAATDQLSAAGRWFDRTLEWALESNNLALQANALTFKGNLAWMTGRIGAVIGLSQAAQRHQSIYIGQLAYAATQEARSHAVAGDRARADRQLDLAAQLTHQIPAQSDGAPPWNYDSPALLALERGLVQHRLGRSQAAADLITTGIAALPAEQRDAEWTEQYRRTLAEAQAEL